MSVSHSGHMYAMMLASSYLCPASGLVEQFGGLSQVRLRYWRISEWVKLFYPVIEIIWCEHSIKTFSAVLSNGITLFDSFFFRYNLHVTIGECSLAFRLHVDLSNCKSFSFSMEGFLGTDIVWEFWQKTLCGEEFLTHNRATLICVYLFQVLFMKNLAEMEDLTPVIEKFSTIAVQVLEGTQFRWNKKNNRKHFYRGEEHWKTVTQSENSTNFLKNEWEKVAFLSGP